MERIEDHSKCAVKAFSKEAAYSEEGVAKLIADKTADLETRVHARVDHQVGSGWTIKRITTMYLKCYTMKPSRGSSYIPTPDKFKNAKDLDIVNERRPEFK
mgnify:CR=1 FL=1